MFSQSFRNEEEKIRQKRDSDKKKDIIIIPFAKSLLFIGKKVQGITTVEKGKSLLLDLNNLVPSPKSVNPSARWTHKPCLLRGS